MQNLNMATTIKAVVSDEEKAAIKERAAELGLNDGQLIRAGLKKMGVNIEVEKERGAPEGNRHNPKLHESSPLYQKRKKQ